MGGIKDGHCDAIVDGQAGCIPNGVTDGDLTYFDGSDWVVLSPGTAGQHLETNGAGSAPSWEDASEVVPAGTTTSSTLRWSGTAWVENTSLLATAAGVVTLNASNAALTLGDGVTTGSPALRVLKGPSGTGSVSFMATDTTPSSGDFQIAHTVIDLRISYNDGVGYRQTLTVTDDQTVRLFDEAQGTGTLYLGNASQGVWTYEGLSGGNVTHIFGKSVGGTTALLFRSVFNADTDGDFRIEHDASEAFFLQRHDGVANRNILATSDDTNLALLSGAQGSSTVTIGGSVNATDEAILVLASGNSGLPAIHFDDQFSRLEWSASNLEFRTYVEATEEFTVGVDAITMLSTVNGLVTVTGSLDAARYVRGQSLIADGDLGAGVASTTILTNVTEASTSGALAIIDCALGLSGNNAGYLKFYYGTTAVYVPYFTVSA